MTSDYVDMFVRQIITGEEVSFYAKSGGGDPWGGYSVWLTFYGYNSKTATFYTYEVEDISTVGYTLPTNQRDISLQELKALLLKEDYP
jgi:hypothetical protein